MRHIALLTSLRGRGASRSIRRATPGPASMRTLGAFGALTTAAIAALGQQDTTRGALLMAALYGAGAGALAEAGVQRLRRVTPEAVESIQEDVKEAAKAVRRAT
jgi:hypothetical protein